MKPNWQSLIALANANENNEWEKDNFEKSYNLHNLNTFEEVIEETFGNTFNILFTCKFRQNIEIKFKL